MKAGTVPEAVTSRWRLLRDAILEPVTTGLINSTFRIHAADGEWAILQRLHSVFPSTVNNNIDAVTAHLRAHGMLTPRLIPCDDGEPWCEVDGRCWRMLTFMPGTAYNAMLSTRMAAEAGSIVGRFHTAMSDFDYDYPGQRSNVHDTARHLRKLHESLATHAGHRLYQQVEPLAQRILAAVATYSDIDNLPARHAHGDLKISNILYADDGRALCLIDLDTVNRMPWPLEMGDALRSWCNPRTEDQLRADLDLEVLDAALAGYAKTAPTWLTPAEIEALIPGLERICLELSARFLSDALTESYFAWDRRNYPTAGEHNLARGHAMSQLWADVCAKRDAARAVVARYL
ncbi:MAG: phosphotransferase [Gammaproteobacteria bacterium]|nr:phosphotransferase [Gammaproteobacteria bacterium]